MAKWTPFPHAGDYQFDAASVKKHWARLHGGDAEPCPKEAAVLEAWALFHNGDFEKAAAAGLAAGGAGITAANKATSIYANYLEPKEKARLDLFMQVAERAEAQAAKEPDNANAWYWHAYALGRYSQGISVAKALAQGLGGKVKDSLEKAIALSPKHADARIALGAFHAEVIDKVGKLLGKTQRRLDAPAKHDGSARFGIDVVRPGMRYASVVMCPTLGGRAAAHDSAAAEREVLGQRLRLQQRGAGAAAGQRDRGPPQRGAGRCRCRR